MAPLSSGRELLESAVGYALACAGVATPRLLPRPTPCGGWDLETLLNHLSDSVGVLGEAVATGGADADEVPDPPEPGSDPVERLRVQAAGLLVACAEAGTVGRRVVVRDRELTVSMVVVTGALEIAVHGWDISVACGVGLPVPEDLAAVLLLVAPLLITPGSRAGLFGEPVRLVGPAGAGDHLVAFLGRRPCRPGCPGPQADRAWGWRAWG